MTPEHAAAFHEHLEGLLEACGRPRLSDAALRVWWAALERYPWEAVRAALNAHAAACQFAPAPADIVARVTAGDGRPGGDEAWAIAVAALDEAETLVWTEEIAQAWGIARPVCEDDAVGARKSFLAAYERLVAAARERLEPARWHATLGTDPGRRRLALTRAAETGRLPRAHVAGLLADLGEAGGDPSMAAAAGLLTGKVVAMPGQASRNARRFAGIVRDALHVANAREAAQQATQAGAAARERERREARRLAELQRLRQEAGGGGQGHEPPPGPDRRA
ncbi:hypothetical protein [Thiococcus pfennigii]|uniref:hypothetical protein n=1 Tax=Thiococcus pfennigii TaxID=1057 RepID=UPI001905A814|nr:hypothetical protein [Thiococcus pfennigii]MBK1732773.1 hypothetical protein [Thiococcus pfennigii]